MFIWSDVSFKDRVYLLIFCLDDLSIDVSGVLKSPTITLFLSIFFPLYLLLFALCI